MKKITLAILCLITMAWTAAAQTDVPKISYTLPSDQEGKEIHVGFIYARDEADAAGKKTYIDWGDGVKQEVIDQNQTPIEISAIGTYKGGTVKIYAPNIYKISLYKVLTADVTNAPELESLRIIGASTFETKAVTELDLTKNINLKSLRLESVRAKSVDFSSLTNLEELSMLYCNMEGELDLSNSPKLWKLGLSTTFYSSLKISPEATFVKDGVLGELVLGNSMFQTCEINRVINEYLPEPITDENGNTKNVKFGYDGNPGMHGVDKTATKAKTGQIHNYGLGKVRCGDDIVKLKDTPDIVLTVEPDRFFSFDIITMTEMTYEDPHGSYLIQVDWGDGELIEYCTGNSQLSGKGNVTGYSKGSEIKFYLENKAVMFALVPDNQRQPGDGNAYIIKADFSNNSEILGVAIVAYFVNKENRYSALKEVVFAPESYDIMFIELEGDLDACALNELYETLPEATEEYTQLVLHGGALEAAKISNTKILYDKGWEKIRNEKWEELHGDNSAVCDDTSVAEVSAREWGIRSEGSSLVVPTVIGEVVTVYNALGVKIAETVATTEETRINGLAKNQIVIVRAGDRSAKVVL